MKTLSEGILSKADKKRIEAKEEYRLKVREKFRKPFGKKSKLQGLLLEVEGKEERRKKY